ncbi:hypothetical protein [Cohnella sp. JJ-181]|uniref:hypothetical protein n=1 Tax=Cohnella rhizoplanae TaxID=2974897 RepID=UPI0022FFBC33|nr:hypothetical protein [Cohnella sp. JJ-181]CAI6083086.1 hypothetical protein COHCIP112018_03868 [Cohnella sp. JJ-181]
MSKIIAASTLALAISIGGAFWGNGAQASTSSAKWQTEQWMWSMAALADQSGTQETEDGPSDNGAGTASAGAASDSGE